MADRSGFEQDAILLIAADEDPSKERKESSCRTAGTEIRLAEEPVNSTTNTAKGRPNQCVGVGRTRLKTNKKQGGLWELTTVPRISSDTEVYQR